jgi:thiamine-phosphate pyrophosphorylase
MFPTTPKDKPRLAGPEYLRQYLAAPATTRIPHLAIGGVTPENIAQLAAVGCQGVAVSAAVIKKQRPAVACRALRDGLAPTH